MWTGGSSVKARLPLFPLPEIVLFPGSILPLHIFEMRYRAMIREVLVSDSTFGVLNLDPVTRKPLNYGCTAEILEVQVLPDGRMNILTVGRRRFHVEQFHLELPYLVGSVDWVEDEDGDEPERLVPLAATLREQLKDLLYLSAKLADRQITFPEDVPTAPEELSYWVAGSFPGLPDQQQALLEMRQTSTRLSRELEIISDSCKQLAARTALKDVFND